MRYECPRSFALVAAVLAVLATGYSAADDTRQTNAASPPAGEIRVIGSAEVEVSDQDDAVQSPATPKTSVPTPAKRKPDASPTTADVAAKAESVKQPALAPEPAVQPKDAAVNGSLEPVPDALDAGPVALEAASFKGVTPGATTKEEVEKAWGKPKDTRRQDDTLVQLYSVEPFKVVEVSYADDKVTSIVIRFEQPFPAEVVAKQLDLATIRPVLVSNDLGELLGQSYPERGVLFAFESSEQSDKASTKVQQIVLEPITAEPFVLRAETSLEVRSDLSLRDLEQALTLEPENARAHWLRSRVLAAHEQHDKAAMSAAAAVRLEPGNAQYRVTLAQALAQLGRLTEALNEAQKAVEGAQKRPHVKARALCIVGDLLASGPKPDYKKAISFHTQAIQTADPLSSDSHPAIRLAAKEVVVDAHLGAAHDIAWGEWKEKDKAVACWLDRAVAVADDLVKNEGRSREVVFRVHSRALAAYVGVRGAIDPGPAAKAAVAAGDELIAAAGDPLRKAQLQAELGTALYDAVQICQMRSDRDNALKYGEAAAQYLMKASQAKPFSASSFMLGRLYFRLGTIHAIQNRDHRTAVVWFDKAIPLLDRPASEDVGIGLGRHGETFISMGVSYWEVGQRQKAVELTQKGIQWMEQAVKQGTLDNSALTVPYNNLAAMHRQLGSSSQADRYQEMASGVKKEKLK